MGQGCSREFNTGLLWAEADPGGSILASDGSRLTKGADYWPLIGLEAPGGLILASDASLVGD